MNYLKLNTIVFPLYILLSFYVLGGGMVNALVAYPTWREVGGREFARFHQSDSGRIIPVFVIFFLLSFIPQILLFWFGPQAISKKMVAGAFILNLVTLLSTITVQFPIQMELNKGFSAVLIEKLIESDLIFRRIPMLLQGAINFIMLYKVVQQNVQPAAQAGR